MKKLFIGVDVGVTGGIAIIDEFAHVMRVVPMPRTDQDILDVFETDRCHSRVYSVYARLERVASSPVMGPRQAFTFGGGYRALKMALTAAKIPYDEVSPKRWQRRLECLSGGDKNITRARAQQLFPGVEITHAIADALLLAEYCRRDELNIFTIAATATSHLTGPVNTDDLGPLK